MNIPYRQETMGGEQLDNKNGETNGKEDEDNNWG
jgi:hypothetical protein